MKFDIKTDKNLLFELIDEMKIINKPAFEARDLSITYLNIDSLELLNLSLAIETKFNLTLNYEKLTSDITLEQLIDLLVPISNK
jgi:acyl carrier protein